MKIRTGHVSNSSSSSFVVGFKKIPQNAEEMHQMLFGATEEVGFDGHPSKTVAEYAFHDLIGSEPLTYEGFVSELSGGHIDGRPERNWGFNSNMTQEERHEQWKLDDAKTKVWAEEKADKMMEENSDVVWYQFSYSDNDGGIYTSMEHGGLFENFPGIRISHH